MVRIHSLFALAAFSFLPVHSIELDTSNPASIRSAASGIAHNLVRMYHGNETGQIPGILDDPYHWWEAGAMFDVLIQYSNLTGDSQYNELVRQALVFQQGDGNFMPLNQTRTLANDDQSTWALAALSVAERNSSGSTWLGLAEAVFNNQVLRWDETSCGGGLRWQIFSFNTGYGYKNSVTNGQFFQLAARLAHYTGNSTYSEWATKAFDWTKKVGLIDAEWKVYDGTGVADECVQIGKSQGSSSSGTYIVGAANMYNITTGDAQQQWKATLDNLLDQNIKTFFPGGIATEPCEPTGKCNTDQRAFKGLLAHQLVDTAQVAPYTSEKIRSVFISTAKVAAKECSDEGDNCISNWNNGTTNSIGVGEQMSALGYVQGLLVWDPAVALPAGNSSTAETASKTSVGTTSPSATDNSRATTTPNSATVIGSGNTMALLSAVALVMWVAF